MQFFFTSNGARLVAANITGQVVADKDCWGGSLGATTAMLAAFSPMFPDNALRLSRGDFEKHVESSMHIATKLNTFLREHDGIKTLLIKRQCGRSKVLRTGDKRCIAVRVLDPE